ncbi:peptidoglycan-binding protein LysM [Leptobacterium sp. I13]|uniref:peptidoglycan-binding protein LysM n=1 Tax=Leptobacterium meishanense TaxID=3128904 RepID=UPI0030ED429F
MRKSILKLIILVSALVIVSLGFTSTKKVKIHKNYLVTDSPNHTVNKNLFIEANVGVHPPFLGRSFIGFKEALAFKESRGDYFITNYLGYMGKYQFGASTLELLGVSNIDMFLATPVIQERAFIANVARNKWILRRDIKRFVGKRIDGILVTESGILAAAHLAGAGNVKKYLRSGGTVGFEDANGVSIFYYMKRFSGYDTSYVSPKKAAKI